MNTHRHAKSTILFLVGGLGLGNSTRCSAIIAELRRDGWCIDVATSARGLAFFSQIEEIRDLHELKQTSYVGAKKSIGLFNVFLSAINFFITGTVNSWRLFRIIRQSQPAAIVTDSNYNLMPWIFRSLPLISLNNSAKIISVASRQKALDKNYWPQMLVELGDSFYQKAVPDLVLSPWPERSTAQFALEPVVREQYQSANTEKRTELKKIVVIYSGSGLGQRWHEQLTTLGFEVTVIGANSQSTEHSNFNFSGETFDSSKWIEKCDLVITAGGFSSLSEALAAKKPMIVIPIEGHAEQFINATWIESLGVGLRSSADELESTVRKMAHNFSKYVTAYDNLNFKCNGAAQAAKHISHLALPDK